MEKWQTLQKGRTYVELAAAAGCSKDWARSTEARGTIKGVYAERLLKRYGVDVRKGTG